MRKVSFNQCIIAGAVMGLSACTTSSIKTTPLTNKEKAIAVISSIDNGAVEPMNYINPNLYVQHNLAVGDALAGVRAVMQQLPKGTAKAEVKRTFQDGNYVVSHTEYNFFGPKAGFDVFRFEDGKIVEHWDNLQKIAPKNISGRTQFDGSTEVLDLDKTDQNKAIVSNFVETILIKGELSKITTFIGPEDKDYLQHNVAIGDGLNGLGAALTELAAQGMPLIYEKNHKILGEGNFVLSISEGQFMNKHVSFYDLFRVHNGMIVEHWDTIEDIPVRTDWQNSNGKFGFN